LLYVIYRYVILKQTIQLISESTKHAIYYNITMRRVLATVVAVEKQ